MCFGKVKQLTHLWPLRFSQSLLWSADEMLNTQVTALEKILRPSRTCPLLLCHGGGVYVPRCYVGVT